LGCTRLDGAENRRPACEIARSTFKLKETLTNDDPKIKLDAAVCGASLTPTTDN
jgi:hypothetical protein